MRKCLCDFKFFKQKRGNHENLVFISCLTPYVSKFKIVLIQEYKFGLEEPMPSMETLPANASEFGVSGGDAEPSSVLEPGQDRRRKKQATKRMEQLIKIHTETLELSDVSGNVDVNTDMGPSWDQQQQTKLVRNCSNLLIF